MGCRLPKLRKAEERQSPGNIYSTLRRPQVETKVGVAYTYHFLDFLLGKEEVPVSSVLCLSSVRELPVQVRDLYAQGFVLVAVHPFVHPCGPRHAHIQRQLHRAVLVRETLSSEKSQLRWGRHRLETDVCVAGHQSADPELIQSYVKKIQDVAEQGVTFVGFLQQPGGGPCFLGSWDPEELSSLHSSPSPIHRHPYSANTSPTEPHQNDPDHHNLEPQDFSGEDVEHIRPLVPREPDLSPPKAVSGLDLCQEDANEPVQTLPISLKESREPTNRPQYHRTSTCGQTDQWCADQIQPEAQLGQPRLSPPHAAGGPQRSRLPDVRRSAQRERQSSSSDSWLSSPELDGSQGRTSSSVCTDGQRRAKTHNNNNESRHKSSEKDPMSPPGLPRMQLFALYNHTGELNTSLRYYSLRVPLQIHKEAGLITDVDAHWLDHMTQHFTSGAQLIDGFFLLENSNDNGVSSVDSVFIFRSSTEETASASYDAIVVEQWTVVDGVAVKADYVPLLQSLAPYGWRLMCVLPTPIVKTNSDGSLSTKQILFLQRPVLQRKRKDFKMLNLRGRSKAKKKSTGGTDEERESMSPMMETEMRRLRGSSEEDEEEEAEARRSWGSGRSEGAGLRRRADESKENLWLQKGLLSGSGESFQEQEEETDVDKMPLSKQSSLRWTDVCRRDDGGGVKAEARTEERIKLQLFSGVC